MDELKEAVNDIKEITDKLNRSTGEELSPEEMMASIRFNKVSESVIEILQNDCTVGTFEKLAKELGNNTTKHLIELLSIIMSAAMLNTWKLSEDDFKLLIHHINLIKADMEGHTALIRVMKKQIEEIKVEVTRLKLLTEFGGDSPKE